MSTNFLFLSTLQSPNVSFYIETKVHFALHESQMGGRHYNHPKIRAEHKNTKSKD